nr:zinc metalloprotease [uncultured Lacibacter sp.]
MKKVSVLAAASLLLFFGCSKSVADKETIEAETEQSLNETRRCVSYEVLQAKLKEDPSLQRRMDEIEAFTARYINERSVAGRLGTDGVMTIPVYVNVLYNTAAENVSDAQIQSQIAVLNEDFAAGNADYNLTSTYNNFKSGDIKIRFELMGTFRKQTNLTSWGTNDAMKKTAQGGLNPTNPTTSLNLWVCNLSNSILGYAQFPGGSSATDGVVIDNNAFGRGSFPLYADFNKGRTATHEVGHWLNLRHIWGDRRCGDDLVGDTPGHDGANYGCPAPNTTSKCAGKPVEMTMNYMDYTNDACMYMFTLGQAARMQATYAVGGPRASLR